jgi:hypothetical protein
MKCLTFEESQNWFSSSGVRIDENRNLRFRREHERIMTTMPKGASALSHLSTRLADWIAGDAGRILWLSNWETYPAERLIQFETMRLGCGEPRHIIDSPGHLFEQSTEQENAVLAGLIFLIMTFNWEGYIVPQNQDEFVYLGDEYIVFSSGTTAKFKEVTDIVSTFHLKLIEEVMEAWK